jgi:hypothetical protein
VADAEAEVTKIHNEVMTELPALRARVDALVALV